MDFQSRFSRNAYFTDTSVCDVADDILNQDFVEKVYKMVLEPNVSPHKQIEKDDDIKESTSIDKIEN